MLLRTEPSFILIAPKFKIISGRQLFCRGGPFKERSDRVKAILFEAFETQAKPSLDRSTDFFVAIQDSLRADGGCLDTFYGFLNVIAKAPKFDSSAVDPKAAPWATLFEALQAWDGWGKKTAAILVKSLYQIHNDKANKAVRFWDDAPPLSRSDTIYVPIDSVIIHIFSKHFDARLNNFGKINAYLLETKYKEPEDLLIWDDLWFWGFITQKGGGDGRKTTAWNNSKYWSIRDVPKESEAIGEIRERAKAFSRILGRAK